MKTFYHPVRRPLMGITSTITHQDGRVETTGPVSAQFTHQRLMEIINQPDIGKIPLIEYRQTGAESGGWFITIRDPFDGDRQYHANTLLFALDAMALGEDRKNPKRTS